MTRKLPPSLTIDRGNLSPIRKAWTIALERMGYRQPPLTDDQRAWLVFLQTAITRVR